MQAEGNDRERLGDVGLGATLDPMELVTVRVGKGKKLHAMTRNGGGMCASVMRARTRGDVEIVKIADGVETVDCDTCYSGLTYNCSLTFNDGKLLVENETVVSTIGEV